MDLPAQLIRKYALEYKMIKPYSERGLAHGKTYGLGPASYDFRCKQHLVLLPHRMYWRWRLYKWIDKVRTLIGMKQRYKDYHCGFALCSTIEMVAIPYDLTATPMDKSTWIRQGLTVHNTHFDPGFIGYPTIELANQSNEIIEVPQGVAICQFKFSKMVEKTEMPYMGKYQLQPDHPVTAKEGKDVWS